MKESSDNLLWPGTDLHVTCDILELFRKHTFFVSLFLVPVVWMGSQVYSAICYIFWTIFCWEILRIVGFVAMVLVLWSPVVVPLFPALVRSWMSHSSSGIADFACIIGLYIAVTILVMLWGKRIRGYEYPLKQYGLDLMSVQKVWIQSSSYAWQI